MTLDPTKVTITPVGTAIPSGSTNYTEFTVDLTNYTTPPVQPTQPFPYTTPLPPPTPPDSYVLTVNAANVQDSGGIAGTGSMSSNTFVIDTSQPVINLITPIAKYDTPTGLPDNTFIVSFSKAINPATFTVTNLALTANGTSVPLTGSPVTIVPTDSTNTSFYINGLGPYTLPPAPNSTPADTTYRLTVNPTATSGPAAILDPAGNATTGPSQALSFVAAGAPFVASIASPSPPTSAPVQSIDITFSDPTQVTPETFALSAISLYKNFDWANYDQARHRRVRLARP